MAVERKESEGEAQESESVTCKDLHRLHSQVTVKIFGM